MAKRYSPVVLLLLLLSALPVSAQHFYQWKDAKGLWNFSNNRPVGVTKEQMRVIFYPPASLTSGDPYNRGYEEGFSLGYQQGYKEYYQRRFEEGRKQGFKEGYHAWQPEESAADPRSGQ